MKFEEAFDLAFEESRQRELLDGIKFTVKPDTAKVLTFFWTMLAFAQNKLDDMAYLDKNFEIISVPLKKEPTGKKSEVKKAADKPIEVANDKETLESKEK